MCHDLLSRPTRMCILLCYAMLCYAMLCYAMLCNAMLRYAMLRYAMLCYAVLAASTAPWAVGTNVASGSLTRTTFG